MEILNIIEKVVSIVCPVFSVILSIIALCKSSDAVKKVNDIRVGEFDKKQLANNNNNSNINMNMK